VQRRVDDNALEIRTADHEARAAEETKVEPICSRESVRGLGRGTPHHAMQSLADGTVRVQVTCGLVAVRAIGKASRLSSAHVGSARCLPTLGYPACSGPVLSHYDPHARSLAFPGFRVLAVVSAESLCPCRGRG